MRFLPVFNPDEASVDFHSIRGGTPKQNITYVGLQGTANSPSFFISDDVSEALEMITKFIPAVLGIVALNALVLICLVVGGLSYWMKRRRLRRSERVRGGSGQARNVRGRLSPMPLNNIPSYIAGDQGSPSTPVAYHPVSMALSEDTFVPPAPAFHKFDNSSQLSDRPKSIA